MNYRQIFAKKERFKEIIRKMCPNIQERSGIYAFYRIDVNNIKYGYIFFTQS